MSVAGTVASGILGIGIKAYNENRQLKQQEKLIGQQKEANKELAKFSSDLQYDMWNKTNYEAQVKHAKDAGLNPALLYGMGGGGGTTAGSASAGSVSGGQANAGGGEFNTAMQYALMNAQKEVLETQAEKNKAEAGKIAGVDTELTSTQIASLTQGISNAKAQEALTKVQTSIGELDAKLKELSMDDALDLISFTARKADAEANIAFNEAYVSGATREEKIKLIQTELIGATLRNLLTKAQTNATNKSIEVSNAQIKKMSEDIAQGWAGLNQGDQKIAIETFSEEVKANYPSLMNTMGRLLDSTIDGIFSIGGKVRKVYNKVN